MFPKELFIKLPDWFYGIAAVIILVGMAVAIYWVVLGAKKFQTAIGRENRIIELQNELITIKDSLKLHSHLSLQLSTTIANAEAYIRSLNDLRLNTTDHEELTFKSINLMQRIVDALSSDVKFQAGDRHRCGLWTENEGQLTLLVGSTEFPNEYIRNRKLDLNWSIAGKCFRKKSIVHLDDVSTDDDWQRSNNSSSPYKSLICIPLSNIGVLTIDAMNPMSTDTVYIGQLYSRIIEGTLNEYIRSIKLQYEEVEEMAKMMATQHEVASDLEH